MDRSASQGGSDDRLQWRGVEPPADWFDDEQAWDDADLLAERRNVRARRRRRIAVVGAIGFVLAGTIVTGTGGGDGGGDAPPSPTIRPPATTVPATTAPVTTGVDGPEAGAVYGTDVLSPIEAGLRYGGSGGGADLRAEPRDDPFDTIDLVSPLPTTIEERWSVPLLSSAGEQQVPADIRDVTFAVGAGTVVAAVSLEPERFRLWGLDAGDGTIVWSVDGSGEVLDLVVAGDAVGVEVRADQVVTIEWFAVDDGDALTDGHPAVAEALVDLARLGAGRREIPVAALANASFVAGESAADLEDVAARLDAGGAVIARVDAVASGRLVLLVGGRLVGVRTEVADPWEAPSVGDASLVVDWSVPGVLLDARPTERGSALLVSNRTGDQRMVVDGATGRTITELSGIASALWAYTQGSNGAIVKQPAPVGSRLVGIGLDGTERWQVLGSPPFALGAGLLVTAAIGSAGLVVTGRG